MNKKWVSFEKDSSSKGQQDKIAKKYFPDNNCLLSGVTFISIFTVCLVIENTLPKQQFWPRWYGGIERD